MPGIPEKDLERLLDEAVGRRRDLGLVDTDALRIVDGRGDGVAGVEIDAFAGVWIVATRGVSPSSNLVEVAQGHCRSLYWKQLDQHDKRPPEHLAGEEVLSPFHARETGVAFEIDISAGYSQGIFLDQRLNRERVRREVGKSPGGTVLNLFSYTCAFSVAAALGGAVTTSLDLSHNYLEWGKRNFQANDLDPTQHFFCKGDAFDWLGRWARSGRRFNGVVCDPPTFSRAQKGKVFRVEKDYARLASAAGRVLERGGWGLFCTNFRGAHRDWFANAVREGISDAGHPNPRLEPAGMPPEFRGEKYLQSIWVRV